MQHSSSCNHRHKSRKQWTAAGFAWILVLSVYGCALANTADKNDSVQQHPSNPTVTPLDPQPLLNDGQIGERSPSNVKIHDPQIIVDDLLVRNVHRDAETITVAHPSENAALDNPQELNPQILRPPPQIGIRARDTDIINDGSTASTSVTDVEYLPQVPVETYQWEPTRTQNDITNNVITAATRRYTSKTQTPVTRRFTTEDHSYSTITSNQQTRPTSTVTIETSSNDDESYFEVLEEPSEVLYGIDPSTATTVIQSVIIDNDHNVSSTSSLNDQPYDTSDVLTSSTISQQFEDESKTIDSSMSVVSSEPLPISSTLSVDHQDQSVQKINVDSQPLSVNENNQTTVHITKRFEISNYSEIDYFNYTVPIQKPLLVVTSPIAIDDEDEMTVTPVYESVYTVSSDLFSDYELNSTQREAVLIQTAQDELLSSFPSDSTESPMMSGFNVSITVKHSEEILSSLTSLSAIQYDELNSSYRFDLNETLESTAVHLPIEFTTPRFTNRTHNEGDSGIEMVTKVPEIAVHVEVNLENKTTENKDLPVTHRPRPIQQENGQDIIVTRPNKPQTNDSLDKTQVSDVKILDERQPEIQPPLSKNACDESKLVSATVDSQQLRTNQVQYETPIISMPFSSVFTHLISPSFTVQSPCPSSSFSTSWIHSLTQLPTVESTVNLTHETSSPISTTRPITDRPSIIKFTTKETYNEDKDHDLSPASGKQPILPTVQISMNYLTVTLRCSWPYFCANQREFQKIFAKQLTAAIKSPVDDSHIVFFNINPCNQVVINDNTVSVDGPDGTISLFLYVTDDRGAYNDGLTEQLGQLMMRNKIKGINDKIDVQNVVLAVQVHRKADPFQVQQPQTTNSHTSDMGVVAAVTISCIAGVCLILLGILLLVLKRRHGVKQQRRCRPVTDAYSLESISIYSSFRKRKIRASKRSYLNQGFDDPNAPSNRLNFAHLAQFAIDENAITEEYKQIPMTMAKLGEMPSGTEVKNRYANVIPFPETRVQLTPNPDVIGSDYINANYVRGFQGKPKHYIACQAPLENTIVDFWQMIWENQCKVIIMVTNWDENGVPKCAQYFSETNTIDNHRLFGDYQITTKKSDVRESFTITYLQLKNLEKNLMRDVIHYWFSVWPAQGTPNDKVSILEMLLEARGSIKSNPGPTVVHCSPGTGRTGTVLAIDTCMQEFELTRTVDVPRCVYHLRRDRGGLVQTTEQYIFIYEVLNEFACRAMNQSGRSSVRSSR